LARRIPNFYLRAQSLSRDQLATFNKRTTQQTPNLNNNKVFKHNINFANITSRSKSTTGFDVSFNSLENNNRLMKKPTTTAIANINTINTLAKQSLPLSRTRTRDLIEDDYNLTKFNFNNNSNTANDNKIGYDEYGQMKISSNRSKSESLNGRIETCNNSISTTSQNNTNRSSSSSSSSLGEPTILAKRKIAKFTKGQSKKK
jgi:hypothetical protein